MLRDIFTSQRQFINYFFDHVDLDEAERVMAKFLSCKGNIVFTGVGKSGIIADKLAKTLLSTGTKSLYLPPSSAIHGDIGMVSEGDLVVMLSKSGKSFEIVELAKLMAKRGIDTMAWVSEAGSELSHVSDDTVHLPLQSEICPFGLAPTTSTAVQLIFGDVIAVAMMKAKKFSIDQYALNHPGGAIGKMIAQSVNDVMIKGEELPLCREDDKLKDVLVELSNKRCGCLLVLDKDGQLAGIFTDGDLRRFIEKNKGKGFSTKMGELITREFIHTTPETLTSSALELMETDRKVMMLPVLNHGELVGLIHIHHILSPYYHSKKKEKQLQN